MTDRNGTPVPVGAHPPDARPPASPPPAAPASGGCPVALVFPPLVESNFGSLYPAPAVLAAYLHAHGIDSQQEDLNEAFAEFLLAELAGPLGAGEVPGVGADSLPAAAARWSGAHRDRLIDAGGRHHFGTASRYGYLLELLAQPFSVDPDAGVLGPLDPGAGHSGRYLAFFEWSGVLDRLDPQARLAGITVAMGPQLLPALLLAGRLKAARPDLRVVLGGPAISLMADADLATLLAAHPAVDCVVRFDGELPLLALARQALAGGWDPAAVPGVSARAGGTVVHRPPAPGPDLNRLPHPRYPRLALARLAEPRLSVTQARGCYWGKCDYCDFVELYGGSTPYRGRHPDNFVEEVARLVEEFGVRRFDVVTESIPPAFARRMCERVLARGLDISWNSFAMVDRRFDRDLLALMVRAGCEFLVVGLETTVTRVLRLVHKSADREENIRFLRDARDVGMRLRVNLIPDLPSTTHAEALAALADLEALSDCVESVSVFPFEATRSSNVGRDPGRFGLLPAATGVAGQSQYALNHLPNVDPGMSPQERADAHRRYRLFADRINARAAAGRAGPDPATGAGLAAGPDQTAGPDLLATLAGGSVRIPAEELDVWDAGPHLVCTQIATRERVTLPPLVSRALRPHRDGAPFAAADLVAGVGPARAAGVLGNLAAARILVPVATGNGAGGPPRGAAAAGGRVGASAADGVAEGGPDRGAAAAGELIRAGAADGGAADGAG